jgi:transposase
VLVIGGDVHKRTHTFVAVETSGRKLGEKTVEATSEGHAVALQWVDTAFGKDVVWGIEDSRQLSARLERDLLAAGQTVLRVPPHLMARTRSSNRSRGKSDPIDALAIARAVLREPDLPRATHDEVSQELKLLADRRDDLVGHRTATINRLVGRIHVLDPDNAPRSPRLQYASHRRALGLWLAGHPGLIAELARDELADIERLSDCIDTITRRIRSRARQVAPLLLGIPGCGELTAAKIVGETAGVTRFKSEAAFACHAGVTPMPRWSGSSAGRVQMSGFGNRQLKNALHRIALTQIMLDGPGRAYYRRRRAAGDSAAKARRCLTRRLARVVYQRLRTDHKNREAR